MAKSNGAVRVRIEAETSGLRQGVDSAAEVLDKFEKGAGRAERGAKAFAGAIGAVTGASGGAVGAVSTLISGFALGGPMGLAIGGVQALITHIQGVREEAAKAAVESDKLVASIEKGIDARRRALLAAQAKTPQEAKRLQASDTEADEQEKIGQQYDEIAAKLEDAERRKQRIVAGTTAMALESSQALRGVNAEIDMYRRKLRELELSLATTGDTVAAVNAKTAEEEEASRSAEAEKVRAAEEKKREEYRKTAAEKLRLAKAADKEIIDRIKAETDQEIQEANERGEVTKYLAERELKESQKQRAREKAEREAQIAAYQQWGAAIGNVLADVFTGAKTPMEGFKAVLGEVIKSVIDMAIVSVKANAASAASGAATSQAATPVVGPALAVGALAMIQALVMGLLSSIPARRYGGDVLAGMPYLIGEEGPEIVKFSRSGTVIPNNRIGREAGSGGITLNIGGVIDSGSLERTLTRNDGAFARAQRKMRQLRRL